MIIKNPINFLAKHYRIITLIMLLPMVYLSFKYRDIAVFFRAFVRDGYKTIETNFADTYVTSLMFGALALMVLFNALMYIMLTTKKKGGLFYGISAIIYIVEIILALLFHGSMSGIKGLDATFANFVRDMANIAVLPNYALIIINLAIGLGFNIKTLRFEKRSLISLDDEEEIEIKINSEGNTAKKSLVHLIRELKYYVLENKFVFSVIGVVAGAAILIGLFINFRVNNRVYTYNQEVSSKTFNIALKESYITNVDYRGNVIAEDTYFLAVKIGLYNKSMDTTIDTSVFRISVGNTTILPTYDRASRFLDIGKPYEGQVIRYKEEDDYVFVYKLTKKQIKGTYKLKILNNLKAENGKLKSSYKVINVKPKNVTKEIDLGKTKVGKEIKLSDTTLGNTTFNIKNYKILDSYQYDTKTCDEYGCKYYTQSVVPSVGKVLMVIDDEIKYDEKSSYYKNSYKDFYGDFVSLRIKPQKIGDKERQIFISPMKNVTPQEVTDVKVYEVANDALNAERIDMQLHIRNNIITINLKG